MAEIWSGRKQFFFEKKNQKTFFPLRTLPASLAPNNKSFLLLFFKKEDLPSYLVACAATDAALASLIKYARTSSICAGFKYFAKLTIP